MVVGDTLKTFWGAVLTELCCRQAKAAEKSYKLSDAPGLHMFVTTTGFRFWRGPADLY